MTAASLAGVAGFRLPVLAWSLAAAEELRFRRIAGSVAGVALVFALLLPWLPRPVLQRPAPAALAAPVARLLIEPPRAITPPPPRVVPAAPQARAPRPTAVPEARRPQPRRAAGERDPVPRPATGMGLLALTQQLGRIHGAPAAVQLQTEVPTGRGVGSAQGVGVGAGREAGLPSRAMITAGAAQGSGGLGNAAFSRDTGGAGLAGRATTLVAGVAGGNGGGGFGGGGVGLPGSRNASAAPGGERAAAGPSRGASARASRSIEDIKLVFDRHKGAIYALYNRALRETPSLQGKVVLELRIAPSGEVEICRIVASELGAAELERQLVARVRRFDFGAKDVEPMVVSWPVDFLPS